MRNADRERQAGSGDESAVLVPRLRDEAASALA
jgi:hypothetical protein